MKPIEEQTTLERIDQLLGYALEQRDTYIKNIGHAPQYHLGYIAALRAIRQHIQANGDQSPVSPRLKQSVCACCGHWPCVNLQTRRIPCSNRLGYKVGDS